MDKRGQHIKTLLSFLVSVTVLQINILAVSNVHAQALCGAIVDPNSPGSVCVSVQANDSGLTQLLPPGAPGAPVFVATTFGGYTTSMVATYLTTASGMAITLAGSVTKTGNVGEDRNIVITVQGGLGPSLGEGTGKLFLSGQTTGPGQFDVGGAAGYLTLDNQDLIWRGFPRVASAIMFGPGAFQVEEKSAGFVRGGSRAVAGTFAFNLVDPGSTVTIPGGPGLGDPVYPPGVDMDIVLRVPDPDEEGNFFHHPVEDFNITQGPECDGAEHWHLRPGVMESVSYEGSVFVDEDPCGAGKKSELQVQTIGLIFDPQIYEQNNFIPEGGGLLIFPSGSLTVPEGVTLGIRPGTSITNHGMMTVNGRILVREYGRLNNRGHLNNNSNTIENSGEVNNQPGGTLNNVGTFKNKAMGTLNNFGVINNTGELCNDGVFNNNGVLSGNPVGACPVIVEGVMASDGSFTDRVDITWTPVDGASNYRLFRCLGTDSSTCGAPIGFPEVASFSDAGATPGVVFYYRVRACTASGCSQFSDADSGFMATQLQKPTGIKATDGTFTDRVRVTFNTVADATVYRLFRCLTIGQTCGSPIGFPKTGTFDDTRGVAGTVYFYRVRACTKTSCGKFSAANTGFSSIAPAKPTNVRATDGSFDARVRVTWNKVTEATVYRMFRCLTTGQTCGSPIGFPKFPVFDDFKGESGVVYFYRVRACTGSTCGKFSAANQGHRGSSP